MQTLLGHAVFDSQYFSLVDAIKSLTWASWADGSDRDLKEPESKKSGVLAFVRQGPSLSFSL